MLGQHRSIARFNEITAIPELLDILALENTLVMLDAMGCQKATAQRILDYQADYRLVPRANYCHAYEGVFEKLVSCIVSFRYDFPLPKLGSFGLHGNLDRVIIFRVIADKIFLYKNELIKTLRGKH